MRGKAKADDRRRFFLDAHCILRRLVVVVVCSYTVCAHGTTWHFNIPEQPLGRALVAFASQAEVVFIAPTDSFDRARANAVVGEYSRHDALRKLLTDTGFKGEISSGPAPTLSIFPDAGPDEYDLTAPGDGVSAGPHPSSAGEGGQVEVIVVTGLRQSLSSALRRKQSADNVVDAIVAEDIGKSTDQNIAEALQRITGISISRADGEGATVTVRGAGPNLNSVTLNGVTLTSSDFNQSVDFSQFSADVLQSIEVHKTSSADHDEGSLGASVRLATFKPLDVWRDRRTLELQMRAAPYGGPENATLDDFKISGSFSQSYWDNRFGVSLVGALESASVRRDRYTATWFEPTVVDGAINANSVDVSTFDPFNVDPNDVEILTGLDIDGDGVQDPLRGHQLRQSQYWYELVDRDRDTVTGTVQFRPVDGTDIHASATYSVQDQERNQSFITNNSNIPRNNDALTVVYNPNTYTFLQNIYTSRPGTDDQTGVIRNFGDVLDRTIRNQVYSIGAEQRIGAFTLAVIGGYSRTTSKDGNNLNIRSFIPRTGESNRGSGIFNGYTCLPNPEVCRFILSPGLIDNTDAFELQTLQLRDQSVDDIARSVFFDVDWEQGIGPFTVFEAGIKWASRKKSNFSTSQDFVDEDVDGAFSGVSLTDFVIGRSPSDWGARLGFPRDDLTHGWPLFDANALRKFLIGRNGGLPPITPNLRDRRTIDQDIFAGYVKANFSLFDETLVGDLGVRIARTRVDAVGFSGFRFRTNLDYLSPENIAFFGSEEAATAALGPFLNDNQPLPAATRTLGAHEYTNVLPSINITWATPFDTLIRFAASQTIARPRIDSLNPAFNIAELPLAPESTAFFGATTLDPFKSTNIDLSAEWYFADDSLVAVTIFDKSLKAFEETGQFRAYWRDFRSVLYDEEGNVLEAPDLIATPQNTLLPFEGGPNQPGCMPNRELNLLAPEGTPGCDSVIVSQSRNGQGGSVQGVELSFQHNLTWAPSWLRHTGIAANYTYTRSETDEQTVLADDGSVVAFFPALPLAATSRHTINTTLYYESDRFLLRLGYNYRTDYLINRAERDGTAHWFEGSGSLDLSSEIDISRNVSLNFQAVNLTNALSRVYSTNITDVLLPTEPGALTGSAPTSRTVERFKTGPIYRASLRFNF